MVYKSPEPGERRMSGKLLNERRVLIVEDEFLTAVVLATSKSIRLPPMDKRGRIGILDRSSNSRRSGPLPRTMRHI